MKKTLLALTLGLAIMPLAFAQTAPATPPANGSQNEGTAPAKKKVRKHRKAKKTAATTAKAPKSAVKTVVPATPAAK